MDASVSNVTSSFAYVGLYGPDAASHLSFLTGDASPLAPFRSRDCFLGLSCGVAAHFSVAGQPGYELLVPSNAAVSAFSPAFERLPVGGSLAFDALRRSALRLWTGKEISRWTATPDMLAAWDSSGGTASQKVFTRIIIEGEGIVWGGERIVGRRSRRLVGTAVAAYLEEEGGMSLVAAVDRECLGAEVDVIAGNKILRAQVDFPF